MRPWRWIVAGSVLLGTAVTVTYAASRPAVPSGAEVVAEARAIARTWKREAAAAKDRRRAMGLYGRAFTAYALVSLALEKQLPLEEARSAVDALVDQVLAPARNAPFGSARQTVAGHSLSPSVAVRGHLALMLEGRALLGALRADHVELRDALLRGLAGDVLATPGHLLPTYARRTWPADNEVLDAALALAVRRTGDESIARARRALLDTLEGLEAKGLPPSEVEPGSLRSRDVPRGCALSWTVAMRGLHAPERARRLYALYREGFLVEVGPMVGFREWPRGVDRPADADSGPIVLGIGTAASGLGLAAARLAGAREDSAALLRSARGALALGAGGKRAGDPVSRAILVWAQAARPWDPP